MDGAVTTLVKFKFCNEQRLLQSLQIRLQRIDYCLY